MSSIINSVAGRAVPLRGNDIDTDRIIPARFLKCVTFDGLGPSVFADDRKQLAAAGKVHPFDDQRFQGAKILIVNGNFGCGSSREHAPQAIAKWGITAIVGVSYSEIFYGNCVAIGVPCLHVSSTDADAIQTAVEADPAQTVTVDVKNLTVNVGGKSFTATMPSGAHKQFITGQWDSLGELVSGLPEAKKLSAALFY
jgi:3-isopropylmalate/(R)-2-methylmalate dehydratase small subunit